MAKPFLKIQKEAPAGGAKGGGYWVQHDRELGGCEYEGTFCRSGEFQVT
jgi:hypothetical protein